MKRHFDWGRTGSFLGGGVCVVALLAAGILAASALGSSPSSKSATDTTKTTICHQTHSAKHPHHTISISVHAWQAHQNHGDTGGACSTTVAATTTTVAAPTTTAGATTTTHGKSGSAPGHNK